MLPVKLEWVKNLEAEVSTKDHEVFKDAAVENLVVLKYYKAEAKEGSEVIAEVSAMPEIAYWQYKSGNVAYVGLNPNPAWSNFYYSSSMPIFWFQFIKWVNQKEAGITQYNHKVGEYLPAKEPLQVTTPSGAQITSANIILNQVGVYTIGAGEKIAVNLVDERESDIGGSTNLETAPEGSEGKEKVDEVFDIYPYLLGAATILLLTELIYYKKRGYFQK
jgi:hypothetical protein